MAKTQAQWFEQLKGWVPEWFFEKEKNNIAILQALAKILSIAEDDVNFQKIQTFILQADSPFLDLHGFERAVTRLVGELNPPYAKRIRLKSLVSQLSKPSLLLIINDLLIKGVASMREDFSGSIFTDRDEFCNRGSIIIDPIENTFSILVDKQIRDPYSFADREFFCDRSNFVGDADSDESVFELIVAAVSENKAFGTLYRIIERME